MIMKKSNFWILLIGIGLPSTILIIVVGGFWLGGCAALQPLPETTTSSSTTTTTTTADGATTSTTSPAASGPISGTVSWDWSGYNTSDKWGKLFVFLWTDEDFGNRDLMSANKQFDISSGQTSADYNFLSPASGIYYLFSMLYVGRSAALFDDVEAVDKIGQYSDGKKPYCFGGTTHAQGIDYTGTAVTGKNFSLNANWSTTTTTVPSNPNWQNIGDVTKNGTASDAAVSALVFDSSGDLYAGGLFDSAGGVSANNIAKWNHSTSSWESLAGGLNPVNALAFFSGDLYAAENSQIKKWDGLNWSSLGGGFTGTMVVIMALAADQDGNIYAGGSFDYAAGAPANNVAKWRTASSTWEGMAGGLIQIGWSNPTGQIADMTAGTDGNIYLAGAFNTTESIPIIGIAKWNVSSSTWEALPAGGGGYAVVADNSGNIYTQPAKWNGLTWQLITDSDPSRPPVWAMAARSPSEVFIGSDGYNFIGKLNGTAWNNIAGELINDFDYADVRALALDPAGDLYVGGKFTSAGGNPAANIVKRINP
jgi:hypothetical protein